MAVTMINTNLENKEFIWVYGSRELIMEKEAWQQVGMVVGEGSWEIMY